MRYFLRLAYDGTNYCGWQVQRNAPSVQETINKALFKLLGHHISSMGCGRTDTGVHAKEFYMHFDTPGIADKADFLFRLNCVLPEDITIMKVIPVADKAHTRFDATQRTYEYYIHFDKSSFLKRYSFYQGYYHINWDEVLRGAEFLKTIQDFTSLCLPSVDFKTNICILSEIKWDVLPSTHFILKALEETDNSTSLSPEKSGNLNYGEVLRLTITSNRFLRGMVRKITGTLLMIGKGKITYDEFTEIVSTQKDFRIHYLSPPNGLFLSKIKYPYPL